MKISLPAKLFCLLFFFTGISYSYTQTPNWSNGIANLIYNNCSSCHHQGMPTPFPLMNYQDVVSNSFPIKFAVQTKHMPPWPADPNYRHFTNEACLEQSEIDDIVNWIDNGMPLGDTTQAPAPPVFLPGQSLLQTIDYTVNIPPYTLQYNTEEYRYFVISPGFLDTVYINQIEVIPGLPDLVHHADISYDITGNSQALDAMDPLPGFNSSTGSPTYSFYMNAWQPGENIVTYPANWGIAVPPGADFVLEIHYGPGGIGQDDTTKINLRFITGTGSVRPIKVQWMLYDSPPCLVDGPLTIPANTVKTFHQVSAPMATAKSFISICPHMHLIGKSYKVWYKTTSGDSIPLIDIPEWDFHWQKYYTFQQVLKIPAGAKIYSEGVYDNTVNNPHNPNSPPINVYKGPLTTDEMFLCYFIFAEYQNGDENIILDSMILLDIVPPMEMNSSLLWNIYPNPTLDEVYISGEFPGDIPLTVRLTDLLGTKMEEKRIVSFNSKFSISMNMDAYPTGLYLLEIISSSGERWVKKMVKM